MLDRANINSHILFFSVLSLSVRHIVIHAKKVQDIEIYVTPHVF